jgi:hypothetical protein
MDSGVEIAGSRADVASVQLAARPFNKAGVAAAASPLPAPRRAKGASSCGTSGGTTED